VNHNRSSRKCLECVEAEERERESERERGVLEERWSASARYEARSTQGAVYSSFIE
jgi:hypothetical protein